MRKQYIAKCDYCPPQKLSIGENQVWYQSNSNVKGEGRDK